MGKTTVWTVIAVIVLFGNALLCAQQPAVPPAPSGHFMPGYPGAPVREYFQPVKIITPEGTNLALAAGNAFVQRRTTPHAVGLRPGDDYRLRITDIPFYPGKEVFPTLKIIARTFPPRGLELEFPILIEITAEDIELALNGKFVTRVVYLENPQVALPVQGGPDAPLSTDAAQGADPMDVAATFGQPVAIVRLGGRIPNPIGSVDPAFFHGSPTWLAFDKTPSGRFEITRFQMPPLPSSVPIAPQPAYRVGARAGAVLY